MRIIALTRYERLGSSSRVRFYQYFSYLRSQGVKISNEPFFSDRYIQDLYAGRSVSLKDLLVAYIKRLAALKQRSAVDLLWVEKELLPMFPAGLEALFRSSKIPYVVDYDDAVFHRYELHPNRLVRRFLKHKIDAVMGHAALVIAGNQYLADRAVAAGAPNVTILPSVVDVSQYLIRQKVTGPVCSIGWIGSPVTVPNLELIRDAINLLHREMDFRIELIGAGTANPFPTIPTTSLAWSEEGELSIGQKFDVGVMPLIDGPFERGKCGYKLVQYMAGAIPVIASPVGVNRQMVEQGRNGYLADSTEDWLLALRELLSNRQKNLEMGLAGRHKAEQLYNLQVTAPKLLNLLSSAVKV
ncbi:MAG TPA: glycosyltransferase family 4 protein [Anaerolineales bacterium]|nr:glycosyltransferase family 4 protein [Anaerolineales bacterium]